MIEKRNSRIVIQNPEKFGITLDESWAIKMIKNGDVDSVMENFDHFTNLSDKTAHALIINDWSRFVCEKLDHFISLSDKTAHDLISHGHSYAVAERPEKFNITLDDVWATEMIENGGSNFVAQYPEKFKITLDDTWATKMIENGGSEAVDQNIDHFIALSEEIAHDLIFHGYSFAVTRYPEKFKITLDESWAIKIAEHRYMVEDFVQNIDNFTGLSEKTAYILIGDEYSIDRDYSYVVVENPEKFGITLDESWAIKMISDEKYFFVERNIESFTGLSEKIAHLFVEKESVSVVIDCPEKFGIILDESWAIRMIKNRGSVEVAHKIKKFTNLSDETALAFIENGDLYSVEQNLDSFTNLSEKVANVVIEHRGVDFFIKHAVNFKLGIEYYAKSEFQQALFDSVVDNIAQGNVKNVARLISSKYTRFNRAMIEKLQSPEITGLLPQNIALEDLLNIYQFDENGRAKLKKEYEDYVKNFSKNVDQRARKYLAEKLMMARDLKKGNEYLQDMIDQYYSEQGAAWFEFENNPDRLVKNQSLDKNIFFLHQMSVLPDDRSYSRFKKKGGLSFAESVFLNVALEPALSTSFKQCDTENGFKIAHQKNGTGGLLLGGGKIMLAFDHDSYTFSDGFDAKYSKYDDTAIDNHVEGKIENILQLGKYSSRYDYNEVILHRPKVCGIFLYAETFETEIDQKRIDVTQKAANEIGVPLFRIDKVGNIRKMGENENLHLEDVLSNTLELTEKKKQQILQKELIDSGHFSKKNIENFMKRRNRVEIEHERVIRDVKKLFEKNDYALEEVSRMAEVYDIHEKDFWSLISFQVYSSKAANIEELFHFDGKRVQITQRFIDEIKEFKASLQ
ncbi:MAG: hypothetical protein CR954_00055 [Candidatus Moraniibacteriota bacterium]|nr:MAG: hypothetical protein CR954_00055 [Candidatus Moranbacteria bacterium]